MLLGNKKKENTMTNHYVNICKLIIYNILHSKNKTLNSFSELCIRWESNIGRCTAIIHRTNIYVEKIKNLVQIKLTNLLINFIIFTLISCQSYDERDRPTM